MSANFSLPESTARSETLEELYQRYRTELRHFFQLNGRRAHNVDDLVQDMFLALLNARPLAELHDARRYLFQVAWNVLHTANRRARREARHIIPGDAQDLDAKADRSNKLWLEDDTSSTVAQARWEAILRRLPQACQLAVLRHYRDGRTYQEIAVELGCTAHTVKKYISKALSQFRDHFNTDSDV